MSRELNPSQVWSQVPVANRLIEVNTKTGFSLTAGSYSVRASSSQQVTCTMSGVTTNTATISSITATRAIVSNGLSYVNSTSIPQSFGRWALTNATTLTGDKDQATGVNSTAMNVAELF